MLTACSLQNACAMHGLLALRVQPFARDLRADMVSNRLPCERIQERNTPKLTNGFRTDGTSETSTLISGRCFCLQGCKAMPVYKETEHPLCFSLLLRVYLE